VSVTIAVAVSERRPLVQLNALDPEVLLAWDAQVTADGSGGFLQGTCTCPDDLSCMFVSASGQLTGVTASNFLFILGQASGSVMFRAQAGLVIDTTQVPDGWTPPKMMVFGGTMSVRAENINTENLNVVVIAYGWRLSVGRNVPQKFFHPVEL